MTIFTLNPIPSPVDGRSKPFMEFAVEVVNNISAALVKTGSRSDYDDVINNLKNIDNLLVAYYQQWLSSNAPLDWKSQVRILESEIHDNQLPLSQKGRSYEAIALVNYAKKNTHLIKKDSIADCLRSIFEYDKTYFDHVMSGVLPMIEQLADNETN